MTGRNLGEYFRPLLLRAAVTCIGLRVSADFECAVVVQMPHVAVEGGGGPPPLREKFKHQRWVVWACAALFYGYQYALRVAPSVMTNDLMAEFGIDAATVGSISSFYYVSYATLQVPVPLLFLPSYV